MTRPRHHKELTPYRAKRRHRGNNHWHIEERLWRKDTKVEKS